MTLNIKNIIKKNIRFISAMIVVIILGIFGISYALKVASFNKIAVNIKSANMDVNISYDSRSYEIAGFFRQVDGGGVVRDLNFENCKLSKPNGNNGGIVCGYLGGEGNLINVNATGCSVTIGDYIVGNNGGIQLGGLAGRPYTTPKYCTFNGYDINLVGIK